MDLHRFNYSMKNIPIPANEHYELELLHSIHSLSSRCQWRAAHFLNPNFSKNKKETYNLKTSKAPPLVKELKMFQDGLYDIAKNLKYRKVRNNFQSKLKQDIINIKSNNRVLLSADKTGNYYWIDKEEYSNYLHNNITKDYKKVNDEVIVSIKDDDKKVAVNLEVDDRLYCTSKRDCFITVKDHKPQFMNNPKFRLINNCKSEIGMVSKKMLSKIILEVKTKSHLVQWKNSDSVTDWFQNLIEKQRLSFIQFDVVDFYGSISPELLRKSLNFASKYVEISDTEKDTILQATQSFLCSNGSTWIKKNGGTFDISMGGYHGAEICDLCGLFLLSQLSEVIPKAYVGLYRDDGMAATPARPRQAEILKKKICKVFSENNLKITIEANMKVVNFLDITLDLERGLFKPYMKENHTPTYVDKQSNHPPMVLKNIPLGVNRRLSKISSSKEVFDNACPPYQDALRKSGYDHVLEYQPPEVLKPKKRCRKKEVTWFNPPFSNHVRTNVGKEFLKLVDTAFPPSNPLHKLFNRHTLKLSYRCMPNMAQAVARHNKGILSKKTYNCPPSL